MEPKLYDGLVTIAGPVRVESGTPTAYRLKKQVNGTVILQGLFHWQEGMAGGMDWRDLPTVEGD